MVRSIPRRKTSLWRWVQGYSLRKKQKNITDEKDTLVWKSYSNVIVTLENAFFHNGKKLDVCEAASEYAGERNILGKLSEGIFLSKQILCPNG